MNEREEALTEQVRRWANANLAWERRQQLEPEPEPQPQPQPEQQAMSAEQRAAKTARERRKRQLNQHPSTPTPTDGKDDEGDGSARLGPLVHMHTARARFRADEETAVPPSSGWWTEGLLRSFRGAVSPQPHHSDRHLNAADFCCLGEWMFSRA